MVQEIVYHVCQALWVTLQLQYMPVPNAEFWNRSADSFLCRLNFPNVIGAIDGKHILIQAPKNSGSAYYNYKEFFSIVLMAIADARCKFVLVDIGKQGSQSDSAVFHNSSFGQAYMQHELNIPSGHQLPGYPKGGVQPLAFVVDAAFPLRQDLLRPYAAPHQGPMNEPEKIFNYRLS